MAPLSENGSPSMIQGAQILALLQEMEQTKITNYSQLAAITFLVYDILLNFHKEVEYVWMTRLSFPNGLYIIARYYSALYSIAVFTGMPPLTMSIEDKL
ncbi:uncharacterized protein ARMOST_11335 [Armillaria ostoyae]|uniref:DUF6533 domain-containing protein n=1 Tax=Armillaria ostoyae TaxID=47428 RepID=A0A284RGV0_ARMOS|nr:uncharacterized protein ARMOST_11335 [Armillaria ostoyae]